MTPIMCHSQPTQCAYIGLWRGGRCAPPSNPRRRAALRTSGAGGLARRTPCRCSLMSSRLAALLPPARRRWSSPPSAAASRVPLCAAGRRAVRRIGVRRGARGVQRRWRAGPTRRPARQAAVRHLHLRSGPAGDPPAAGTVGTIVDRTQRSDPEHRDRASATTNPMQTAPSTTRTPGHRTDWAREEHRTSASGESSTATTLRRRRDASASCCCGTWRPHRPSLPRQQAPTATAWGST